MTSWGRISSLTVANINYAYADTASVTLKTGTADGTVVNVQGTGEATDLVGNAALTVDVGLGNVQGILGPVSVENPPNFTTLIVDDRFDPNGNTATLNTFTPTGDSSWGQISGLAVGNINYEYPDTSSVTVNTGTVNGSVVNVLATGTTTNVIGNAALTVNVGNRGSTQAINGTLNLSNPPNLNTLTVDDSADTVGRTVTLSTFTPSGDTSWGAISGLAPADINYRYGDTAAPATINTSTKADTVNVQATGTAVVLNTGGGNDTVNVGNLSDTLDDLVNPLTVNGGTGTDTLNLHDQGSTTGQSYTLGTTTLQRSGAGLITFSSVEHLNLNAGSGSDTLTGPNAARTWSITGSNAGKVGPLSFTGVENLVGGTAADTFQFSDGQGVTGTINGGAGTNTLDYSLYTTGVSVNLASGTATGTAGISKIANVTGGSGNDNLYGNSAANVLLGNAGDDTIVGGGGNDILVGGPGNDELIASGSSRSILIGGAGQDTLTGGSGDDILIGGTTAYDANTTALLAIMKEWKQRSVSYADRIAYIRGTKSGGLNGNFFFSSSTVSDDGVADTLTGGAGLDWFWAGTQDTTDRNPATEQLN
jgi:Ca2+-binding RTX toxin-like protein